MEHRGAFRTKIASSKRGDSSSVGEVVSDGVRVGVKLEAAGRTLGATLDAKEAVLIGGVDDDKEVQWGEVGEVVEDEGLVGERRMVCEEGDGPVSCALVVEEGFVVGEEFVGEETEGEGVQSPGGELPTSRGREVNMGVGCVVDEFDEGRCRTAKSLGESTALMAEKRAGRVVAKWAEGKAEERMG